MHGTVRVALLLFLLAGTGCTTTETTPATTPTSIAPVTTAVPGTVVTTTTSTTVTTTTATTTTVDRLTEIAAIFEDLERRRLQAIFDQDEEAFRAVHANKEYLEESLVVLDLAQVSDPSGNFRQVAIALIADEEDCVAATLQRDYEGVLATGAETSKTYVASLVNGVWGLAWVGEGWACDGPHPLS